MEIRFRIPSNAKVTQTPPSKFVKDNSLYVLDQSDNLLFAFNPRVSDWSWRIVPSPMVQHPEETVLDISIDLERKSA